MGFPFKKEASLPVRPDLIRRSDFRYIESPYFFFHNQATPAAITWSAENQFTQFTGTLPGIDRRYIKYPSVFTNYKVFPKLWEPGHQFRQYRFCPGIDARYRQTAW